MIFRLPNAILQRLLARMGKQVDGGLDLGAGDATAILWRALSNKMRGSWHRLFLGSGGQALLVGKRAQITHRGHIHLGRGVKIEDGAEVQGLASDGLHLGDGVTVGRMASIRPSGYYGTDLGHGLRVGSGTAIGAFAWIGASGPVQIGSNVLMGPRVIILPENHNFDRTDTPIKNQGVTRLGVSIGDDCWIGADSKILAGVHIGAGSIVAAGAVVHRDVAPGHVVGGVPARVLKVRDGGELKRSA